MGFEDSGPAGSGRLAEARAIGLSGAADRAAAISAAIRQAVVEQRLPPGTKLPEDQLGSHFGASRTLVRSALQSLARDGIVVLARNRGASVASPGPDEARELFDARRIVEAETTARAAKQATTTDLDDLESVLTEARAAIDGGDRGRAIRLSGHFHVRIAQIARQTVLEGFLRELVTRSSLVIALYGHRGRSDCGDAEHSGLVAALQRRDERQAVAMMLEHLDHIEADLDLERQSRTAQPLGRLLIPAMQDG